MNKHKKFLIEEVPELLKDLRPDHKRFFGIMTPQHMVEHLIWVTKSSVKDHGPAPESLSDKQKGFMRFIQKGAHFLHRQGDLNESDLQAVRMKNIQSAIDEIPNAIDRLYQKSEDHLFYNPLMGQLTFKEMELFHYKHFKYHLQHQFGLGLY